MTRMKEKDPEQARGEAECSKHRGPKREPAGSFLGGLGSSGDCWQVDRQLLFPAQAVLTCVCVCVPVCLSVRSKIIQEWL